MASKLRPKSITDPIAKLIEEMKLPVRTASPHVAQVKRVGRLGSAYRSLAIDYRKKLFEVDPKLRRTVARVHAEVVDATADVRSKELEA